MWDLDFMTRDQIWGPCVGRWSLHHWTTREVLMVEVLFIWLHGLECSISLIPERGDRTQVPLHWEHRVSHPDHRKSPCLLISNAQDKNRSGGCSRRCPTN